MTEHQISSLLLLPPCSASRRRRSLVIIVLAGEQIAILKRTQKGRMRDAGALVTEAGICFDALAEVHAISTEEGIKRLVLALDVMRSVVVDV